MTETASGPSFGVATNKAWANMWPNFGALFLFTFLTLLVANVWVFGQFVLGGVVGVVVQAAGFSLVFILIGPCLAGLMRAHLLASRGETVKFSDYGYGFQSTFHFSHAIFLWFALAMMLALSSLAFVLPAFFLGAKLQFALPRFVESKCTAGQAIQEGWDRSAGQYWGALAVVFGAVMFLILGTLALGIGVLVAFVFVPQVTAAFYNDLDT
jgi:hypothetical protein